MAYSQGNSKFSIQNTAGISAIQAFTVDTDLLSEVAASCQASIMEASPIRRLPPPKTLLSLQTSLSSPFKVPFTPAERLLRVRRPSFYQLPAKEPSTGSSIQSMSFTVIGEVKKRIGQTLESLGDTSHKDSSQEPNCIEECSLNDNKSNAVANRRPSLRKALTSKDKSTNSKYNPTSKDQSLQPELIFKDLLNMDLNGRLVIDLEQMRRNGTSQLAKTGPLDVSGMSSQSRPVSVRSILVKREKSARELRRNDTDSPKKKVAFAKNKMVMLFEKDHKEKSSR